MSSPDTTPRPVLCKIILPYDIEHMVNQVLLSRVPCNGELLQIRDHVFVVNEVTHLPLGGHGFFVASLVLGER